MSTYSLDQAEIEYAEAHSALKKAEREFKRDRINERDLTIAKHELDDKLANVRKQRLNMMGAR